MSEQINWNEPFKAEDFEGKRMDLDFYGDKGLLLCRNDAEAICAMANARFRELLEDAPVYFAFFQDGMWWAHQRELPKDTHCGHFICIEEINPKEDLECERENGEP